MNIALVAATPFEIAPLMEYYGLKEGRNEAGGHSLTILITGAGMVPAAYALTRLACLEPVDMALNAGVAGSFRPEHSLGDVFAVKQDCFSELGAQDGIQFLSIDELNLGASLVKPLETDSTRSLTDTLKSVQAVTVNTVHGYEPAIERIRARLDPDIESMEGAAFFYVCNRESVPSLQIRSISNYVERRNRANWNMPLAIESLNKTAIHLLNKLL